MLQLHVCIAGGQRWPFNPKRTTHAPVPASSEHLDSMPVQGVAQAQGLPHGLLFHPPFQLPPLLPFQLLPPLLLPHLLPPLLPFQLLPPLLPFQLPLFPLLPPQPFPNCWAASIRESQRKYEPRGGRWQVEGARN